MEPRPSQSGGSLSAKAGAGTAAFISVGGTSVRVCARRSTVLVRSPAACVWQIGKSELDDAGATVALAAPMSAPLPPDMASPMSEPRKTMPPRLMAVVENRVSRDRCVMIPSKNPQRRTSLLRPDQQFCRTYALTPRMSPYRLVGRREQASDGPLSERPHRQRFHRRA